MNIGGEGMIPPELFLSLLPLLVFSQPLDPWSSMRRRKVEGGLGTGAHRSLEGLRTGFEMCVAGLQGRDWWDKEYCKII